MMKNYCKNKIKTQPKLLKILFLVMLFCVVITEDVLAQGATCNTAEVLCQPNASFNAATTGDSLGAIPTCGSANQAPGYPKNPTLSSTPRAAFYTLQIKTSGDLHLLINTMPQKDVDFAIWGPYPTLNAATNCNGNSFPPGIPIDCDYSQDTSEQIDIPGVLTGQVYILMITNFSGASTEINLLPVENVISGQQGQNRVNTATLGGPLGFNFVSQPDYLLADSAFNLPITPDSSDPNVSNVVFSGTGVTDTTNGTFDPSVAGVGMHTVTVSGTSYACPVTSSININVLEDSDGDGVADVNDLDDDNDGILDAKECDRSNLSDLGGYYESANFTDPNKFLRLKPDDFGVTINTGSIQRNLTLSHDYSSFYGLPANSIIVNLTNANVHATVNEFIVQPDAPTVVEITGTIGVYLSLEHSSGYNNSTSNPNGSCYEKGIEVLDVTDIQTTEWYPFSVNQPTDFETGNSENYFYQRRTNNCGNPGSAQLHYANTLADVIPKKVAFWVKEVALNTVNQQDTFFIRILPECDTDKDGIPNRLDLDSDNDNCLDAIEGGDSILTTSLVNANNLLTVGTGSTASNQNLCADSSCIDSSSNGVPSAVAVSGQTVNDSQDATESDDCKADLSIVKTVNETLVKKGDSVIFTLKVTNSGTAIATGVTVKDVLPSGLTYVSSTMSGSNSGQDVSWNIATINLNQTIDLTVTATVNVNSCSLLSNNVEIIQSNQEDTDSTPNSGN